MTQDTEFAEGEKVAIYQQPNFGTASVRWATVERTTKTQYILDNGRRFRKDERREVGVDRYRSPELIGRDDPRVFVAVRANERARLVNATFDAWEKWHRDRSVTPTALIEAAQAVAEFDAGVVSVTR